VFEFFHCNKYQNFKIHYPHSSFSLCGIEMLEICMQTYDKNVQLTVKSYLPVVYGTPLITYLVSSNFSYHWSLQEYYKASLCVRTNTRFSFVMRFRIYLYWSLQEYYKASLCVRTNTPFSFVIRLDHTFIGPYKNITKPHYVLELTPDSHL
jgi:hypothetical protein